MPLIVVVAEPRREIEWRIACRLHEHPAYEVKLVAVAGAVDSKRASWPDRLYAGADRRVFGRPAPLVAATDPGIEPADLATALRTFAPVAIVDLSGLVVLADARHEIPVVTLHFADEPPAALDRAVRRVIGTKHGVLHARARAVRSGADSDLFAGQCFVDHRSVVRSVELIVNKTPMILQAALRRMKAGIEPLAVEAGVDLAPRRSAASLLRQLAGSIAQRLRWRDQWKILIYRDSDGTCASDPWTTLVPDKNAFWADPFVVPHERGLAVFLEELPFASDKGRLSVIEVDHEGRAGPPSVVLDLPWHLSYPFVFESEGKRFMLPESSAHETLDLYACVEFPTRWTQVKTLMSGVRLADASLIRWEGRWWMFAAHGDVGASNYDELHLFWADDLMGDWHPHPLNPVKIDAGSSRPAGAMFVADGKIVRPTQDCRARYGDAVVFQEVLVLDSSRFEERTLRRLAPAGVAPAAACHTFNQAGGFAVIDSAEAIRR